MQTIYLANGLPRINVPQGSVLLGIVWKTATGASTYTPTAGTKIIFVECIGGGGGGTGATSGSAGQASTGGGGGGGGYAARLMNLTDFGASFSIAVGAGGGSGSGGGVTRLTAQSIVVVSAAGGGNGGNLSAGTTEAYVVGGGGGSAGQIGEIAMNGNPGGEAHRVSGTVILSGYGGAGIWGGSVIGRTTDGIGGAGGLYGGGGAGGVWTTGASKNGGAGGQGIMRIWEFTT